MVLDSAELAARLHDLIPARHIDFVKAVEDQIVIGDEAFVHAGIRPGVPLEAQ